MADLRPPLDVYVAPMAVPATLRLLDGRSWSGMAIWLSPQAVAYPSGNELQVHELRPRVSLRRDHFPIVETDAELQIGGQTAYVDGIDSQDDEVRHVFVRELRT